MSGRLPDKVAPGGEVDVQLAPLGDWAQTVGGKRITTCGALA